MAGMAMSRRQRSTVVASGVLLACLAACLPVASQLSFANGSGGKVTEEEHHRPTVHAPGYDSPWAQLLGDGCWQQPALTVAVVVLAVFVILRMHLQDRTVREIRQEMTTFREQLKLQGGFTDIDKFQSTLEMIRRETLQPDGKVALAIEAANLRMAEHAESLKRCEARLWHTQRDMQNHAAHQQRKLQAEEEITRDIRSRLAAQASRLEQLREQLQQHTGRTCDLQQEVREACEKQACSSHVVEELAGRLEHHRDACREEAAAKELVCAQLAESLDELCRRLERSHDEMETLREEVSQNKTEWMEEGKAAAEKVEHNFRKLAEDLAMLRSENEDLLGTLKLHRQEMAVDKKLHAEQVQELRRRVEHQARAVSPMVARLKGGATVAVDMADLQEKFSNTYEALSQRMCQLSKDFESHSKNVEELEHQGALVATNTSGQSQQSESGEPVLLPTAWPWEALHRSGHRGGSHPRPLSDSPGSAAVTRSAQRASPKSCQ